MTYYVNAGAGLNLRSAPSTSAAVLVALPYKTPVESLADPVNGWRHVRALDREGFCADTYLTLTTTTAYASVAVNLRRGPGTGYSVLTTIPVGGAVTYDTETTILANGYQWRKVDYIGTPGFVAIQYLSSTPPPAAAPTKRGHLMGLHKQLFGVSNGEIVGMAQRLSAAGKPLEVVVVVSDPALAAALIPFVKRVVYRWQAGTAVDNPDYGSYPAGTDFRAAGADWMAARWNNYKDLDPAILIQPINEATWHPADAAFWLGILDFLEGKGRKAVAFADAVGNPDDSGLPATQKWQSRQPVLQRLKARGHYVGCHIYSQSGTPEGQLSLDLIDYELRIIQRLYGQMGADAQPDLLILEAAREFVTGAYANEADTLNWLGALQRLLYPYPFVRGIAAWTAGKCAPFEHSSIDAALPAYEKAILAGRYPSQLQLTSPVAAPRITQGFGANPQVYAAWGLPGHEGIDYGCAVGTPVLAVAAGVVSEIRLDGGQPAAQFPYGNQIRIQSGEYTAVYAHLSEATVRLGQVVTAGMPIALSGNTGNSSGPHLHLTLKKAGATKRGETNYPSDIINPAPYLK